MPKHGNDETESALFWFGYFLKSTTYSEGRINLQLYLVTVQNNYNNILIYDKTKQKYAHSLKK